MDNKDINIKKENQKEEKNDKQKKYVKKDENANNVTIPNINKIYPKINKPNKLEIEYEEPKI